MVNQANSSRNPPREGTERMQMLTQGLREAKEAEEEKH